MKLTESRKAMIARHVQEIERAVESHKARMVSIMERQNLELMELMLVEDPRQKPHDVIAMLKASLQQSMLGEFPGNAEYEDAVCLIRMLDRHAQKFPTVD